MSSSSSCSRGEFPDCRCERCELEARYRAAYTEYGLRERNPTDSLYLQCEDIEEQNRDKDRENREAQSMAARPFVSGWTSRY